MNFVRTLSSVVAAIAVVAGMTLSGNVQAADASIFVDQKSPISEYGSWVLTLPGGGTYMSNQKSKIVQPVSPGTYTLTFKSPTSAIASIQITRSGEVLQTVTSNSVTFTVLDGETVRATVSYSYTGTVTVDSSPGGVPFTMKATNGIVYTGTTPATYKDMAPIGYSVSYAIQPDCQVQKDQQRGLIAGSTLAFYADFTCGETRVPTIGRTTEPLATSKPTPAPQAPDMHTESPDKRVLQTSNISEVVPGGTIRFTVSVRNITRTTLHDVVIIDRYNQQAIEILKPLLDGGVISGNELQWNVPKIYAGQTWETTFQARASSTLKPGDRIVLMAHATSDESAMDLYPEAWSSVVGVAVAMLPQTGMRYDIALSLAALLGAAVATTATVRRKRSF